MDIYIYIYIYIYIKCLLASPKYKKRLQKKVGNQCRQEFEKDSKRELATNCMTYFTASSCWSYHCSMPIKSLCTSRKCCSQICSFLEANTSSIQQELIKQAPISKFNHISLLSIFACINQIDIYHKLIIIYNHTHYSFQVLNLDILKKYEHYS